MDKTKRIFLLLFLLLLFLSAQTITGCQKQDEPAKTKEKITIAYSTSMGPLLVLIAFAKNDYAGQGLDAVAQPHEYGRLCLQALLDGKADIATTADTPIMFAAMNGRDIVILAQIQSSAMNEGVFALKNRGITKPSDLRGKKIGVTLGTAGDYFLDAFLEFHHLARKQIKTIHLAPSQMPSALRTGLVDAVAVWNPTLWLLQKQWGTQGVVFFGEHIYKESFCLVAQKEYARKNPETIKKLLRALIEAETFAQKNPQEAQRLVAAFIPLNQNTVAELWDIFTPQITLTQELIFELENQTRWATKNNLVRRKQMPNYIDYLYIDGLKETKPEAVSVIY